MASCLTENEARGFSCQECYTILCSFFPSLFLFFFFIFSFSHSPASSSASPSLCFLSSPVHCVRCCARASGPLPTSFIEPPQFLCQTTFVLTLSRLPLVSLALSCLHPCPPLPHTKSLPVHATVGGQPSGCPFFHCHGNGTKTSKHGKNKHVLQHEKGEQDGTSAALLITPEDGKHLPRAQPDLDLPWAALQPSSHLTPSVSLSLSLFPCLSPRHFHCNQNTLPLSFL